MTICIYGLLVKPVRIIVRIKTISFGNYSTKLFSKNTLNHNISKLISNIL